MQCPQSIYQASETGTSTTPPSRGQGYYVPGRYAGDGPEERRLGGTTATDNVAPGDLGLCSEPREVAADFIVNNPVLGFPDRFQRDANQAKKGDTAGFAKQGGQQKQALSARELAQLIGKMIATLPAVYQAPLWYRELKRLKNQAIQKSQSFSVIEPGSPDGVEVVVNQNGASQRKEYTDTRTGLDGGDGRIIAGLGYRLQGHTNRGPMVPDRMGTAHKLLGTACSHFRCESIHQG